MAETRSATTKGLEFRAQLPRYVRYAAIVVSAVVVAVLVVAFYRGSRDPQFRMQGFPTSLSKDVVAAVSGYERTEFDGGVAKYYVKADKATTFADNHQELENAYFEIYDQSGSGLSDKINADKAVYIPEENKNFTAYLAGSVDIETRDRLKVQTEQVTYKKATEIALAEEAVTFQRDNLSGKSFGAEVKVAEKKLELHRDVDIKQFQTAELAGDALSTLIAGSASYDQLAEKIHLNGGVKVNSKSETPVRTTDLSAGSGVVSLAVVNENTRDIRSAELFSNVAIDSVEAEKAPTKIRSGYAMYEKPARYVLRDAVRIETADEQAPTTITAANAVYEQNRGTVDLTGAAEVLQGSNFAKGDSIFAELYPSNKLKRSTVKGNGYVRQIEAERTIEVSAGVLVASLADGQTMTGTSASSNASAVLTPAKPEEYSKVTMSTPKAIALSFRQGGSLEHMVTDGRTTIQLDVPNYAPDSANKRLTADTVKTFFADDGKNMQKAEAVGNAELHIEPLKASVENYRTTVNAPRFDCGFFPTGNNAKDCTGGKGTKTVRVPTVPAADRGNQTLTAETLHAVFAEGSRDLERLDASGDAKFTELDRNGIADQISFSNGDKTVRLRGGEPTVWDLRARAKAKEIDWNTAEQKSYLRDSVSTTYYSQKSTGGAAPFGDTSKPVYITADSAEIDHRAESAVYTGKARAWQDKSYVSAAKFVIRQNQGQFDADGGVQSLLYDVKRKENGRETTVPVSVASRAMSYFRDQRLIRYLDSVDIRQGTDRITGRKADVYLDANNELAKTEIENDVVITQPKRRATGTFASYTAENEVVVLKGNPARVEDAEQGTSQGAQMTVYLRDNRVSTEGRSTQNTAGRTRSVYKVQEN
ncbi:MAG TPA: LPS export ABC transporter periplasmic protein LptC [Pyrinomonadaceae bacterium]